MRKLKTDCLGYRSAKNGSESYWAVVEHLSAVHLGRHKDWQLTGHQQEHSQDI